MEKIIKIGIFVVFVGYIVLGMIIDILTKINNVVYGIMAICAANSLVGVSIKARIGLCRNC